jgi:hypothetical protein
MNTQQKSNPAIEPKADHSQQFLSEVKAPLMIQLHRRPIEWYRHHPIEAGISGPVLADSTLLEGTHLHLLRDLGRELHVPLVRLVGDHGVRQPHDRGVDVVVGRSGALAQLPRVVERAVALGGCGGRRVGGGGEANGGGCGSGRWNRRSRRRSRSSAHGGSSSCSGDRCSGSREGNGVVVGANHALDDVQSHEAVLAAHLEVGDSTLDALQDGATIRDLLRIEATGDLELVAADVVVPLGRTSGLEASDTFAGLVSTILVADLDAFGEGCAVDVVEDSTTLSPGRLWEVGGHDVHGVALLEGPGVGGGGGHLEKSVLAGCFKVSAVYMKRREAV